MNRKLRNTILAFSVTGTVLALGLMAARPVAHPAGPQPAAIAAIAAAAPHAPAAARAADGTGQPPVAQQKNHAGGGDVEARILARSQQFEQDIAQAASLQSTLALTAGFVAAATAEAVVAEILSAEQPAAAPAEAAPAAAGPETAPRRRRGSVRGAVAVPYFSFARAGHGGRS